MQKPSFTIALVAATLSSLSSCSSQPSPLPIVPGEKGVFCGLPGSVQFGSDGPTGIVAGAKNAPSLAWLTLPDGYCAHYFAHVPTARQVRFAPGGELFVASPATPTAGGAPPGLGAILVLADDNADGYADGDALPHADGSAQKLATWKSGLASTQGILFANDAFYYQDSTAVDLPPGGTAIMRLPYKKGQRVATGTPELVADVTLYQSTIHWPKTLDQADDGTIYVGNGGDQSEVCDPSVFPRPFHGGVLSIGGPKDPEGGTPIAQGFRNPIAVQCEHGKGLCFAAELALDESGEQGGREKIVPIRKGDDWGFPCCATANTPYTGEPGSPNCSTVVPEEVSFAIGATPFGMAFETGVWPAPYTNDMFVVLHGVVASWVGAGIVALATDGKGLLAPASGVSSPLPLFAGGWDDGNQDHGRPAAIAFSKDGRAFVANDVTGDIFWIAPMTLKTP